MNKQDLITKLNSFSIEDILKVESQDYQFIALEKGSLSFKEDKSPLLAFLTICNALICYQLSRPGEVYWKEFIDYIKDRNSASNENKLEIENIFNEFFTVTKGNKRLQEVKLKRIAKISPNYLEFKDKWLYFYENQERFIEWLCKIMNQKETDKTIAFSLKMFNYICRILTKKVILAPQQYILPIDSRIENLSVKYNEEQESLKTFWKSIAKDVKLPLIHLDSILWTDNKLWD